MSNGDTNGSAAEPNGSVKFFRSEAHGGILLLLCTIAALGWANSPWSGSYFELLHAKIGLSWNDGRFALSWDHWINDGLMALFFFVVGLEIKREIAVGELSSPKKAALPVAAAIGGMVVPASIYAVLNRAGEGVHGWGIPMATDIAFALGILALLGPGVPAGLKVLLTAIAIADDLGAVLVIALFYSGRISVVPLLAAGVCLALIVLATRLRVKRVAVFALLVIGVWLGILFSGIHATVSGILVAMVVPVQGRIKPRHFFAIAHERLAELEAYKLSGEITELNSDQMKTFQQLHQVTSDVVPAGLAFERYLHPVTAYVILPLFALFNAGVVVDDNIVKALANPVGLGILLGLAIGKPAGIMAASWIVIRSGLADMPAGVTWVQIHGSAILSGIGFTMAIFITDLAMPDQQLLAFAKLGVLTASALSAVTGYFALKWALRHAARLRVVT